jgi:ketosteroid isomerase-like protein
MSDRAQINGPRHHGGSMRITTRLVALAIVSLLSSACNKSTPATADSAGSSSTPQASFDENAARAEIVGADSGFVRALIAKNVDSLMSYYDPSIVSLGKVPLKGSAEVRKSYVEAVKSPPRDVNFQSGGVDFSNDHSMAWDYGTVSQTVDIKGKPVKMSGTFMNVWKNVGGKWKNVAEISSVSP